MDDRELVTEARTFVDELKARHSDPLHEFVYLSLVEYREITRYIEIALNCLEAAGKRIEGLEERLDWQIANGHKVNDDQQASLRAEVSMLRSQLRAAEDRADMRTAECAEEISALTNAIREWNLRAVEISKSRRRLVEYLLWYPSDSWDARPDTPAKREIEEILNEKV